MGDGAAVEHPAKIPFNRKTTDIIKRRKEIIWLALTNAHDWDWIMFDIGRSYSLRHYLTFCSVKVVCALSPVGAVMTNVYDPGLSSPGV